MDEPTQSPDARARAKKPKEPVKERAEEITQEQGVTNMAEPNQSFDARRMAREQESRIAAASAVGLNATKPLFQYHTSMLRLWADNVELMVRNYESGVEAFTTAIEQQIQQRAA